MPFKFLSLCDNPYGPTSTERLVVKPTLAAFILYLMPLVRKYSLNRDEYIVVHDSSSEPEVTEIEPAPKRQKLKKSSGT